MQQIAGYFAGSPVDSELRALWMEYEKSQTPGNAVVCWLEGLCGCGVLKRGARGVLFRSITSHRICCCELPVYQYCVSTHQQRQQQRQTRVDVDRQRRAW